jgi:hypothetical protein
MHHRKVDSPIAKRSSAADDAASAEEPVNFTANLQRQMWALLFLGSATYGLYDIDFVEIILSHQKIDRSDTGYAQNSVHQVMLTYSQARFQSGSCYLFSDHGMRGVFGRLPWINHGRKGRLRALPVLCVCFSFLATLSMTLLPHRQYYHAHHRGLTCRSDHRPQLCAVGGVGMVHSPYPLHVHVGLPAAGKLC